MRDVLGPAAESAAGAGVTSIVGMAGAGKSVLARAVVDLCVVRRRFPDGMVWVRARGLSREGLTREVGRPIGYRDSDEGAADPTSLVKLLRASRRLVVLDDPESVEVIRWLLDRDEGRHDVPFRH